MSLRSRCVGGFTVRLKPHLVKCQLPLNTSKARGFHWLKETAKHSWARENRTTSEEGEQSRGAKALLSIKTSEAPHTVTSWILTDHFTCGLGFCRAYPQIELLKWHCKKLEITDKCILKTRSWFCFSFYSSIRTLLFLTSSKSLVSVYKCCVAPTLAVRKWHVINNMRSYEYNWYY